jgi:CheY-like chemotaxis protein
MTEQHSSPIPRLLLVEDRSDIAAIVRDVLEIEGYALVSVAKPAEAASRLRADVFDLVLTDGLSSDRARAWQNALAVLRMAGRTPVALFTAHAVDEEAARAAGFLAVIRKPFDVDALANCVRTLLDDASTALSCGSA